MKKVKEIKILFEDEKTLENETIVCSDLEDKCAVIWGDEGIMFYEDAVNMMGNFNEDDVKKRQDLIDDIRKKCKSKNIETFFVKGNDCLPS